MLPKIIHYCWFGRNPLPKSALKCIASWKKFFPDYEIIEWNEDNFDVNSIPYTAQAYEARKYAFVSDYARFKILYEHGGLYFDTDVEVIRSMDDIIAAGPFMGFEIDPNGKDYCGAVNPGLGLGATANMPLYANIMEAYKDFQYLKADGSQNMKTVVMYVTEILQSNGLTPKIGLQEIEGITIYPKEFFNPLDSLTGRLKKTENTRSIHWYTMSWLKINPLRQQFSRIAHRIFGVKIFSVIQNIVH